MIYALFANGASVIPLFVPGIPQFVLLAWAFWAVATRGIRFPLLFIVILACLGIMVAASIVGAIPEEGGRYVKLIINVIVSALVASGMEYCYKDRFPEVYSKAILMITLVAILGLLLAGASDWHISSSIMDRQYNTNLLTTWLMDGGFNSSHTVFSPFPYRLQAMFDEPGTFGMLLVPAFFYFVAMGNVRATLALLCGVFLTESANAWVLCLLILVAKAYFVRSNQRLFLIGIPLLIAAVSLSWPYLVQLYEIKAGLDEAYENSSSLGVRSAEYAYLRSAWDMHLLPFQNRQALAVFSEGISVSYVSWYLAGGSVFIVIMLSVTLQFFCRVYSCVKHTSHNRLFAVVLAGTMLLSGFQRSSFLDNVLFMSLTFWALMYRDPYPYSKEK